VKLYCCYTPAHEILLKNYFLPSIPSGFDVTAHQFDLKGNGVYLSTEYMSCIQQKIELVISSLIENRGEIIVWSDIDLIFLRDVSQELTEIFIQSGCDILYQSNSRDRDGICGGFFICRGNDVLIEFYRDVARRLAANPTMHDQDIICEMLPTEERIKWGYLPVTYYVRSMGWPPPKNLALYHAASGLTQGRDGLQVKISLLKEIQSIQRFGFPALVWSCVVNARHRIKRLFKFSRST